MTVEEIIRMLDDPGSLECVFREAERIEFTEIDRIVFNTKRRKYSIGMSDSEKIDCAFELKCFLYTYVKHNKKAKTGTGNYESDPDKKWCHLDHNEIKHKFDILLSKKHKLNVIMIEDDSQAFSDKIPEILHVYYCRPGNRQKNLASIKGDSFEDFIYFDSMELMRFKWSDFINTHFEYNQFKGKNKHKETYFVVHSVANYNALLIGEYLKLWESLKLKSPLYVFIHLKEKIRPKVSLPDNCICLYNDDYESISADVLDHFCDHYHDCYSYDPVQLAGRSSMSYRNALKTLQFCQK